MHFNFEKKFRNVKGQFIQSNFDDKISLKKYKGAMYFNFDKKLLKYKRVSPCISILTKIFQK